MNIVIATLETSHFTFTATGTTRQEANNSLLEAWAKHAAQYSGADTRYALDAINDGEINYIEMPLGSTARDGSVLYRAPRR